MKNLDCKNCNTIKRLVDEYRVITVTLIDRYRTLFRKFVNLITIWNSLKRNWLFKYSSNRGRVLWSWEVVELFRSNRPCQVQPVVYLWKRRKLTSYRVNDIFFILEIHVSVWNRLSVYTYILDKLVLRFSETIITSLNQC